MRWIMAALALAIGLGSQMADALAEARVALVIGNSAYQNTQVLTNPLNDARDVSAALKTTGFDVVEAFDADKRRIDAALRAFTDKLTKADVALFFYAGHGLQVGLQNFLVPVDAKLERERDLEFEAVRLDFVLRQMEIDREGKTSIVILDACRDNPLSRNLARTMGTRSTAIGKGLAAATTGLGTFIAYSTQPGNVALDGDGRNSPFTAALVKHMGTKGRNLPATMIEVRKEVVAATQGRQVPWDHSALTGDFYFVPGAATPTAGAVTPAPAGSSADLQALQDRLRKLEEEAKRRDTAAASPPPAAVNIAPRPAIPPVTPKASPSAGVSYEGADNVRIEGLMLEERRQPSPEACRDWCSSTAGCAAYQHGRRIPVMGQCVLFSRVDGRREDVSWRSGIRLSPATAAAPAGVIPATIGVPLSRKEAGYDVYDGVSVMTGDQIKMSATDSIAGCRVVCQNTPNCKVAVYNDFFKGKNLACQVFLKAGSVIRTPSATMLVRTD